MMYGMWRELFHGEIYSRNVLSIKTFLRLTYLRKIEINFDTTTIYFVSIYVRFRTQRLVNKSPEKLLHCVSLKAEIYFASNKNSVVWQKHARHISQPPQRTTIHDRIRWLC